MGIIVTPRRSPRVCQMVGRTGQTASKWTAVRQRLLYRARNKPSTGYQNDNAGTFVSALNTPIAAGSTITGILVQPYALVNNTGAGSACSVNSHQLDVALTSNLLATPASAVNWTSFKSQFPLTNALATCSLGGDGDLWGRSWTPSDFANNKFALKVRYTRIPDCASGGLGLNFISVTVFYTPPASADNSTITGSGPVVADGVATSAVTITLKDAGNNPVSGVTPTFSATDTGSTNVYGGCSSTSALGVSNCTLKSTTAEIKTLSIVTPVAVTGGLVTFTSATQNTTTTVTSSSAGNTSTYGDPVTFTATVTPGVTTGSITFIEGGTCASPTTTLQAATAVNGSGAVTFMTSTLTVPSHTIVACYGGATGFSASNGSVTQTVNKAT